MNISTYIPDDLLATVDAFASKSAMSRSAIIREGLELFLARHRPDGWPQNVRDWSGDEQVLLDELRARVQRVDDPFATVVRSL